MKACKKIPGILTYFLVILFYMTISCSSDNSALSKSELHQIAKHQNEMLSECFTTANIDKLAEMYTDSAKLSPNGLDFVFGRNKIKAFWENDFNTSQVIEMKTEVLTIDGNEQVIYETGKTKTKILYNDSIYTAHVKYINVWQKQIDGSYKLDVDFWNQDIR
jgi:ketosteroid isomerase-like protein